MSGNSSPTPTGEAAPIVVRGAIAVICATAAINVPAEAALAPVGDTKTTTGIPELEMISTIFLVDSKRPPGVSIFIMKIEEPSVSATTRDLRINLAVLCRIILIQTK